MRHGMFVLPSGIIGIRRLELLGNLKVSLIALQCPGQILGGYPTESLGMAVIPENGIS